MHYFGQYIFFYKPRVQRHKKGIEDSSTELECLADSSLCQVLIYILLKKRKKNKYKKNWEDIHTKCMPTQSGDTKKSKQHRWMPNIWCMDQPSTRNQEPTAPCDSNKQSVSFETNNPTSETDADFETSPSYIMSNFVKVEDSTANTDTDPHAYKPIMLR